MMVFTLYPTKLVTKILPYGDTMQILFLLYGMINIMQCYTTTLQTALWLSSMVSTGTSKRWQDHSIHTVKTYGMQSPTPLLLLVSFGIRSMLMNMVGRKWEMRWGETWCWRFVFVIWKNHVMLKWAILRARWWCQLCTNCMLKGNRNYGFLEVGSIETIGESFFLDISMLW